MVSDNTPEIEDLYTLPTYKKLPISVVRGRDCHVWGSDGKRYLDFYGGHCVAILGHNPPGVCEAIRQQLDRILFYSNAVYSPTRARAAAQLVTLAPQGLSKAFFCNSGTEANETALKLARTWSGRSHVVAMEGSFHGRTLGSLAATWSSRYRDPYAGVLPPATFVPFGDADSLERVLASNPDVAAVILEPVQSMAGIRTAPPEYFLRLRETCTTHGVSLIFDEVQTGVGRTGTFSYSEQVGIVPDMITLAKSLGSGVPVGAVLVSREISESVRPGDQGTTFGGGMLAMAAVSATLDAIEGGNLMHNASQVYQSIESALTPHVGAVRGAGCLIGIEFDQPAADIQKRLFDSGVLVGSSSDPNVIRLMPPVTTPASAIDEFLGAFHQAITAAAAA